MINTPIWKRDKETTSFPVLNEHITADVAIIGAGITGVILAQVLSQRGLKVALLEALQVSGGTTGYSTGNLYSLVDVHLHKLESKYDEDTVKTVVSARSAAVDLIRSLSSNYKIDCSFRTAPWWLIAETEKDEDTIEKEAKAIAKTGLLRFEETNSFPLNFPIRKAVRVDGQAQFNPLVFVRALSKQIAGDNCRIYESSPVTHLEEEGTNMFIVRTKNGSVRAKHVVHATHVPKGIDMIQTILAPYREYAIGALMPSGKIPPGIFWILSQDHHHSVRSFTDETGKEFMIVLGEPHKTGQNENNIESVERLNDFARKRFGVLEVQNTWGAQHYRPADLLPYIGRRSSDSNIYYSTGYSTDGLTYGAVGAMIIADQISEKENAWAKTFDASRVTPVKSSAEFIKENLNVLAQYIKDLPFIADTSKYLEIKNGEGKVVEEGGEKLAVYRDENGKLEIVSAVCTHMKCIVNFNQLEKTWDCPCHGSRFNVCGNVLEGPALTDLSKPTQK